MTPETSTPASDLLTASGEEAAPVERRVNPQRRRRDRRNRTTRIVGMDVSHAGVALAILESDLETETRQLTTHRYEFPENSGPPHGDWTDGTLEKVLAQISEEHQLTGCATLVGISGALSVTRILIGSNDEVDFDARELAHRSRHYMGMGRGEKVQCSQEVKTDAKHKRKWVTVAMRSAVDTIAAAVRGSGMRLCRIEHSLLPMCRAFAASGLDQDAPLLLVTREQRRLELGISYQGQLLLDYRPSMPNGEVSELDAVSRHVKCLRRFLKAKLPECPATFTTVVLAGGHATSKLNANNSEGLGELSVVNFPVNTLTEGFEAGDEDLNDPCIIAAICLVREESLASMATQPTMTNDLRSTLGATSKVHWRHVAMLAWPLAAAAMIAGTLTLIAWNQSRQAEELEQKIAALAPERMQLERIKSKQSKQRAVKMEADRIVGLLPANPWNRILYLSGSLLPQDAWLDTVKIDSEQQVLFRGASFAAKDIYKYISDLKETGLFRRVSLESTSPSNHEGHTCVQFEITAESVRPEEQNNTPPPAGANANENLTATPERGPLHG